jgi:tetratricopeptide (TPR) repeat protein
MNPNDPLKPAFDHHRAGRFAEAETLYRQAVARNANDPRAMHLLGTLLIQRHQPAQAVPILRSAARIAPDVPDLQFALGDALRLSGAPAEAEHAYQKSLSLRPLYPIAHNALGLALVVQGKLDAAIASWQRAIQLKSDYAEPHANLGTALAQQKKFAEAVPVLCRAVELNPKFAPAHNNLANVLDELQDFDSAIRHWRTAIELQPAYLDALVNVGRRLQLLGRNDEAIDVLTRAVTLKPDHGSARFLRGLCLLTRGDLASGFADYGFRTQTPELNIHGRSFPQPAWDGRSDLTGNTILIHAEQGIGDTIQFVRYAPLLADRGARVIVECPPDIATVLQTVRGVARVIPRTESLPSFDLHAPLLDLPRLFGTTLETIPSTLPYLAADRERTINWMTELSSVAGVGKRVGLVWSGNPKHNNDKNRSLPLRAFEPLAALSHITFISLQKGPGAAQLTDPTLNLKPIDPTPRLHDFADTAALIKQLDLVITVDTSVAHLAGALGQPVWVLLPHNPDWRWMLDRTDSPWYPTMRLFRQSVPGQWEPVIRAIAEELQS